MSCSGPAHRAAGRTMGCMGKHPSHRPHLLLFLFNKSLKVFFLFVKHMYLNEFSINAEVSDKVVKIISETSLFLDLS